MEYDALLNEANAEGITIKERPFKTYDGRIKGNNIYLRKGMTSTEKTCVLSEELGHHYTTVGNILDQNDTSNRKQELRARAWAYDKLIGLQGIIEAHEHGCANRFEIAEFLEVTESFLIDTLARYKQKYGQCTSYRNYVIYFEPLGVLKICK